MVCANAYLCTVSQGNALRRTSLHAARPRHAHGAKTEWAGHVDYADPPLQGTTAAAGMRTMRCVTMNNNKKN